MDNRMPLLDGRIYGETMRMPWPTEDGKNEKGADMINVVCTKENGELLQSLSFPASEMVAYQTEKATVILYSKDPDADLNKLSRALQLVVDGTQKVIETAGLRKAQGIVEKWNAYFAQENIDDPEEACIDMLQDFIMLEKILTMDVWP